MPENPWEKCDRSKIPGAGDENRTRVLSLRSSNNASDPGHKIPRQPTENSWNAGGESYVGSPAVRISPATGFSRVTTQLKHWVVGIAPVAAAVEGRRVGLIESRAGLESSDQIGVGQ